YVHQEHPLGTAHALTQARDEVGSGDAFLCLPGDNVVESDALAALLDRIGERRPLALVTESEDPSKYGVLYLRGDSVVKVIEKPPDSMKREYLSDTIATGIYLFPVDVMETAVELVARGESKLSDLLTALLKESRGVGWVKTGLWADAVYPWDLLRMNALTLPSEGTLLDGRVEGGVVVRGPVRVGVGTVLRAGSYLQGPISVGAGCEIGPNAVIQPCTAIGDNVHVGACTVLSNSIVMSDSRIGAGSVIENSILGPGCTVGPGVMAYRGEALIRAGDEHHLVDDVGAMVADDTSVCAGAVLEPGTVIGPGSYIGAGRRINGQLPAGSRAL
ncbi:MAG TPA: hypothetical protein EYP14_14120, partial [Planctomycetaceae bacterium]|nr:hypothetical protein [Planctomycetaceae bacterium]